MRFLLDENVDLPLADYLNEQGHDATAVARDYSRSIKDQEVLEIARAEGRILITNDKDFGALIYQRQLDTGASSSFACETRAFPRRLPVSRKSWLTMLMTSLTAPTSS